MSIMQMTTTLMATKDRIDTTKENPLDLLAHLLQRDMANVNAIILQNMQSDVALIPQLAKYLIAAGGKRIRPLLTLGAAQIFGASMEKAYYLAAAVEFIHTATLLHDDVVDESEERRGQKSANMVFGNQASVLVGDFLFSKAFQLMVEGGSLEILKILSNAAAIIAQGEVLQLSTTNNLSTSMQSYMEVIESKTAALFAAACEIGPVLGNAPTQDARAMHAYGLHIGIAFQIIDDTLDYMADQAILGKTIGDDFREGKMTAPVLFALAEANEEEKKFWQRTLAEKKQTEEDFAEALKIINHHDAITKSHSLARTHIENAKSSIKHIQESDMLEIFSNLADYVAERAY